MADEISAEIEKIKKSVIAKAVNQFKREAEEAMVKTRRDIVDIWFGEFNPTWMKNTIDSKSSYTTKGNDMISITVSSWFDPLRYDSDQSIQKWNTRKREGGKSYGLSEQFLMEYVMNLQIEQGIIGLPYTGTMTDNNWTNEHFYQKEPLGIFLENHPLWDEYVNHMRQVAEEF